MVADNSREGLLFLFFPFKIRENNIFFSDGNDPEEERTIDDVRVKNKEKCWSDALKYIR